MRIQFQNFTSDGTPATKQLTVTVDGDRHTVTPAGSGIAVVPDHVGRYLVESDALVIAAPLDSDTDSDTDSDSDSDDEETRADS